MTSLAPQLLALDAGGVAVGIGLLVLALGCMVGGTALRHARVPTWVETYPGRGPSFLLPLPVGGWGVLPLAVGAAFPHLDSTWVSFAVLFTAPALPLYLLFAVFWCPQVALPRWYRRAKRAGVAPMDLAGMTGFKALPIAEQKALAQRPGRQ